MGISVSNTGQERAVMGISVRYIWGDDRVWIAPLLSILVPILIRIPVLILALLVLAGCPSLSVQRAAEPVPPGQWRVSGALAAMTFRDIEYQTRIPSFQPELTIRRGLVPGLDAGLTLYGVGIEADATWRVHRGTWTVALAPALGGLRSRERGVLATDAIHVFAQMPVIFTRPISPRLTPSIGPSVMYGLYLPAAGGSAHGVSLGGFANIDIRVGEHWHIVPELALYRTVAGEVPVHGVSAQAGLGLAWGL